MHLDRQFRTIALRLLRHLLRSAGEIGPILSAFTAKHCPDYTPEEEQLLFHVVYELASVRTDAIANFIGQRDDLPEVDAYSRSRTATFRFLRSSGTISPNSRKSTQRRCIDNHR